MDDDFIDYGHLIDDAMHVIVKKALEYAIQKGLPGRHHFFISFVTDYPGVKLSVPLRQRYPEEMTIVLQHQFEDLQVMEEGFSVVLSFDNVKERIQIPFDALVAFADPSVKFGLQFRHAEETGLLAESAEFGESDFMDESMDYMEGTEVDFSDQSANNPKATKRNTSTKKTTKSSGKKKKQADTNVVSIDTFRKK